MRTLQRQLENFKMKTPLRYDAPLKQFTTFQVGGTAEVLAQPGNTTELAEILTVARELSADLTVLGGGANVVISDRGIPGITLHTARLQGIDICDNRCTAAAGTPISDVAAAVADKGLEGLDFIYAMPGSTGGAVWMNARCYDGEIAAVLEEVQYLTREGVSGRYQTDPADFSYKVSPFQDGSRIITAVTFALQQDADTTTLWRRMKEIEADRAAKGHFEAPCAGSIFKNDRRFGEPSGKIIDRLGLRGLSRGGARVSDRHGNIIINTGTATARDIRDLVTEIAERVYGATGFALDPEVLFVGDWS